MVPSFRFPGLRRGVLKKLLVVCAAAVLALFANGGPLVHVVLNAATWSASSLPSDWELKVNHGKPQFAVQSDAGLACIHLRADRASFGLERQVDVDPAQYPYLSWTWKVSRLPAGGDFRKSSTDDQAAQVLVAFTDRRVVSYIWDTSAPDGASQSSGFIPLLHVFAFVCQSGAASLNQWVPEARNLAADYQKAYHRPAPHVKGVRIQINSQHTGTLAESYFSDVAFRSALP